MIMFTDLSHAWVVSFVSIKALVDLFSQSGVLLWSPKTHKKQSYKLGKTFVRQVFVPYTRLPYLR